jgi:hypothetical protein
MVGVAVEPPLTICPLVAQLKVTPDVEEDPFNITEVTKQVSVLSEPAFALGVLPLEVTTATSEAVQPEVLVTVNV